MELKELRQKTPVDLKAHLLDLHKEQFSLRMQKATGQLAKTHDILRVRRDCSRQHVIVEYQVRVTHDRKD